MSSALVLASTLVLAATFTSFFSAGGDRVVAATSFSTDLAGGSLMFELVSLFAGS